LIQSLDFQKVVLLTNISKEEGANFIEIRISLEDDLFALKDLNTSNCNLIFSIEPGQFVPENEDKIVNKIKQLAEYGPYAIEINTVLSSEKISEVIDFVKKREIKIHLAKYFVTTTKISDIKKWILLR